jgi:hypothetical protein
MDSSSSAHKVESGDVWRIVANGRSLNEVFGGYFGSQQGYAVLERLSDFSLEKFFQTNSDISQGDFAIVWEV